MSSLLPQSGDFDSWNVYKKSAIVCDVTEHFITHHMTQCRTVDQMRQAARSGKQNIVEGMSDSAVSVEMCIKLLGVARGSLRELREDYKDYLRQHRLKLWGLDDKRTVAWRTALGGALDINSFSEMCILKSPEAQANVMITVTSQLDCALAKISSQLIDAFQRTGGIKEKLSQIRRAWRRDNLGY